MDSVDVRGNVVISEGDIVQQLSTKSSPRFLGLFQGLLYEYRIFNRHVLARDLERVERYYQARGFYRARARAGRIFYVADGHVRVEILVEEGQPTTVERIEVVVDGPVAAIDRDQAWAIVRRHVPEGKRFEEEAYERAQQAVSDFYANNGYAHVSIERQAFVDIARNRARLSFRVKTFRKSRLGEVRIIGLGPIPEAPVRRALDLQPGDEYDKSALRAAQQAVLDLGVFATVQVEPVLEDPPPDDGVVPVDVRVTPAQLRQVEVGGGVELDVVRADAHGVAGWQHRNFFGGLRRFQIRLKPGVVLYPTRLPTLDMPTRLLPFAKLENRLEQPGFLEARTRGILRADYEIFPVLLATDVSPDAPVIGYREFRGSTELRRRFGRLSVSPSYNLQTDTPFAYAGELSPLASDLYISYVALHTALDLRDDAVSPHQGLFAANTLQYAGVGGDARDVRVEPELRTYLPISGGTTFALRGKVGFLVPFNYDTYRTGQELTEPPSVKDTQISYFRSFFSGGPNSNRGYPYRGVGPHGPVTFFNPALAQQQLAVTCNRDNPDYSAADCSFPLGGRSLWEASAELRRSISEAFSAAFFCDASDVSLDEFAVDLDRPHLSCGAGLRYATPVGPIRFDLGYRIPGLQTIGPTTFDQGDPGEIFGLPLAVTLGIGEAF